MTFTLTQITDNRAIEISRRVAGNLSRDFGTDSQGSLGRFVPPPPTNARNEIADVVWPLKPTEIASCFPRDTYLFRRKNDRAITAPMRWRERVDSRRIVRNADRERKRERGRERERGG